MTLSLDTTSKWVFQSDPKGGDFVSAMPLNPLRAYLSLPQVTFGPKSSADIWSVGCTVIEMATRKPPWSQQYQEVAALFHIGTTKSHPPIPEHLSFEAKDFFC